jgi:hypothetical protein
MSGIANQLEVIEQSYGGMHWTLRLCLAGRDLLVEWKRACAEGHVSFDNYEASKAERMSTAAKAYYEHRCRCMLCRIEVTPLTPPSGWPKRQGAPGAGR